MNKLTTNKRIAVVSCLVEGSSIRATVRMTGVAKNTVIKLLVDLGSACMTYQDQILMGLPCKRIQCDEIWSFCYARPRNLPENLKHRSEYGDVWTWTALCADTKLMTTWHVGKRSTDDAVIFMADVKRRMAGRIQLTVDGFPPYRAAVQEAFGKGVDFAQLIKIYAPTKKGKHIAGGANVLGIRKEVFSGRPKIGSISTSFVERQNLTMRMGMRRFTRATNGFSKKIDNLRCAIALHFFHYNFARVHQTLKTTPAVAAGVSKKPWSLTDVISLLD